MSLERNTVAISIYIDATPEQVAEYLSDGEHLGEYTLFSRMRSRVDEATWVGSASGYQGDLYYHVRGRAVGDIQIVEWHCGAALHHYHHVYPMLMFPAAYFSGAAAMGTHYHWVSFVDPARATPMIVEGMPAVHGAEARSLKGRVERRRGRHFGSSSDVELRAHTIFIEADADAVATYLADVSNVTEWSFMLRRDGGRLLDEYDRELTIKLLRHDLGAYTLIEHVSEYAQERVITPFLVFPCSYAFGTPEATGTILHRVSAWSLVEPRRIGKTNPGDYDCEAINTKRIIESRCGNLDAYAKGCSYQPKK